jgi:hypothetical protein
MAISTQPGNSAERAASSSIAPELQPMDDSATESEFGPYPVPASFAVEIRLVERTEKALMRRIFSIQNWLDHRGFEPTTFRYTFFDDGIVLQVDFRVEEEAVSVAEQFKWLGARLSETYAQTDVKSGRGADEAPN